MCCCSDDDKDGIVVMDTFCCNFYYDNVVCNSPQEVGNVLNQIDGIKEKDNKDVSVLLQKDYSNSSVVFVSSSSECELKSVMYDKNNGLIVEFSKPKYYPLHSIPHCDIIRISPKIPSETKIILRE